MHGARVDLCEAGHGHARCDLAVEGVAAFQYHLLADADLQRRLDVGVVAVVPLARLRRERLASVDANGGHDGLLCWVDGDAAASGMQPGGCGVSRGHLA